MANVRDPFFGRTELGWEELEAAGWQLLANCAVQLTNYTHLNRELARFTGQTAWNFSNRQTATQWHTCSAGSPTAATASA